MDNVSDVEITRAPNNKHYDAIDVFRLLCSVLIMMVHINPFDYCDFPSPFSYANYFIQNYVRVIALPFFFVTSGFLLYRKTTLENIDYKYILRYIRKIFRLYVIWTIIYFPLEVMISRNGTVLYPYHLNIIFSGSFQMWYLNALMFAVAVTSFLLYKRIKPKTILMIAFCFNVIAILSQSWYGLLKPFQDLFPGLGNLVSSVFKIILTTKDGLFFGFFYVSMGMYFAFTKIEISKRKCILYLAVSSFLMLLELLFTDYFKIANGHEIGLFMIPVTFFIFYLVVNSDFKLKKNYELGSLSALMFYTHMWIGRIYRMIFSGIQNTMFKSVVLFLLSLITTVLVSEMIIYLSKKEKFRFLKYLYK